jgi:hypothetical protein
MRHFFYYFHWSFCLRQIWEVYRESGIRGYWKGLVPTLIMVSYLFLKCHTQSLFVTYGGPQLLKCVKFQVCNPSIQFMIYETLAKRLQSKRSGKQLPKRNLTAMEVQTFRWYPVIFLSLWNDGRACLCESVTVLTLLLPQPSVPLLETYFRWCYNVALHIFMQKRHCYLQSSDHLSATV